MFGLRKESEKVVEMPFELGLEDQERVLQAKSILRDVQLSVASHIGHKLAARMPNMAHRCFRISYPPHTHHTVFSKVMRGDRHYGWSYHKLSHT